MNTKLETLIANLTTELESGTVNEYGLYAFNRGKLEQILAALRQGQGEPVAVVDWIKCRDSDGSPYTDEGVRFLKDLPIGTKLFTSPPAPQARELLPPEQLAAQAWCTPTTSSKVMDTDLCSAFADIIAADRAIRPAAGMVSDKLICEAVVATQFMDEHRRGRMTCDVQELLAYINERKSK